MSVLKNYINNKEDLLDISNPENLKLNMIEWNLFFGKNMSNEKFNKVVNDIPKADLYLISNRLDTVNTASLTIEITLALYLIRKYNSKVFMGGGHFNESTNLFVKLINKIGKEYTGGLLEYVVGTIGINIYNFLQGYEYQNKRSCIERKHLDLQLTKKELDNYFENSLAIELIRGCPHKCPYCCNGFINKYDRVDISIYQNYFEYLNNYFPNTLLYLCAPELNTDKKYFLDICKYLCNNVKNPLSFYINLSCLDDEQFDWILKLNLAEIKFSIDGIFEDSKTRTWQKIDKVYTYLQKLQKLKLDKNINVYTYIVTNIPGHPKIDWNTYKDIFSQFPYILAFSEFYIFTSTDYFYNPQKYGISFIYYQNRYKELYNISNIINKIPVMYFRDDINRKELVNKDYEILRHMKKQIFIDMCRSGMSHNSNIYFTLNQMCHIYPDLDLIDNHDVLLDKYINTYTNNIGYKLRCANLTTTLHNIFDKK